MTANEIFLMVMWIVTTALLLWVIYTTVKNFKEKLADSYEKADNYKERYFDCNDLYCRTLNELYQLVEKQTDLRYLNKQVKAVVLKDQKEAELKDLEEAELEALEKLYKTRIKTKKR